MPAGDTKTILRIDVLADGTARTSTQLADVGAAVSRSGQRASAAGRMWSGLGGAVSGVGRGLRTIGGALTSTAGLLGVGLGVSGLKAAVDHVASFDSGLLNLRHSSGASREHIAEVGAQLTTLSTQVGRSRDELLAAAAASVNLGLGLDEIVASMADASNWARLLGVDVKATTGALTAARKVAGEGVSLRDQMAVMDVAVRRSGMQETDALALMQRVMPEMAAVGGLEGIEGLKAIGQMIAAVGGSLGPEQLQGGIRAMGRTFNKDRERLGRAGIDTSSFEAMFADLAGIAHRDAAQLRRLRLPDELVAFVLAAGEGLDKFVTVGQEMDRVDAAGFQAELDDAAASQAAAWDSFKVQLQQALLPLGEGALKWLVDHKDDITGAIHGFTEGLAGAAERLAPLLGLLADGVEVGARAFWWFGEQIGSVVNELLDMLGIEGDGENAAHATAQERDAAKAAAVASGHAARARSRGDTEDAEFATAEAIARASESGRGSGFVERWRRAGFYARHGAGDSAEERARLMRNSYATETGGSMSLPVVNEIHIRVDPETVHAEVDKRNTGRRQPMTTTTVQRER